MLPLLALSFLIQSDELAAPNLDESIRCATATSAYRRDVSGEELGQMTRASQGWAAYIRQTWDPQTVTPEELQAIVQASSTEHASMLEEDPGQLFQIAVHCYNRIVAIAAQQAQTP